MSDIVEPRLSADEPSFDVFWEAVQERRAVAFDYRTANATETTTRPLQPWGVARYSGRWYVVGLDTDRGEERVFRLSRVEGQARPEGPSAAYEIPPGTDLKALARRLAPDPVRVEASLLVRRGAGHTLRRGADLVEEDVPGPDERTRWDRVRLTRTHLGLDDEVLTHGDSVVVEEPAELRDQVVARLSRALGHDVSGGVQP